jgi:hypothetical protein
MRIDWGRKWNQMLDLTLRMFQQGHLSIFIQAPSCNRQKMLTSYPSSKVCVAPQGCELLPHVAGSKRIVHWTGET